MALLKFKRSAVPGKVPTLADLSLGELAINTFDGKVYIRKDSGTASIVEVGGGSGVLSFNSRTGAVTLTSGDVTGALGFTPYNSSNPAGYITSSGSITGSAGSAANITGGNQTGSYEVTSGQFTRFGHANQTDVNDGKIGAALFDSGLNIVGTQTSLGTGRQVRVWGSLINSSGTSYVLSNAGAFTGTVSASVDLRAPIYYDSNNTAFYLDPANSGTSLLTAGGVQFYSQDGFRFTSASAISAMRFGSSFTGESTAEWAYNRATAVTSLSVGNTGSALNTRLSIGSGGDVTANVDLRAPIFYDSNNTAFYLDPNQTSNINALVASVGTFTNDAFSRVLYLKGSGNIIQFQDADGTNRWENVGRNGTYYVFKGYGTGSGFKWQIDDSGNHTFNGIATFNTDVRSPIFYDSNNTAFYTDPASTSVLNTVNLSRINMANSNSVYADGDANAGWRFGGTGYVYFNQASPSYFQTRVIARDGISQDGAALLILHGGTSAGTQINTDTRSPIYYDLNNTNFYLDAAANSVLNTLSVSANDTSSGGGVAFGGTANSQFIRGRNSDGASATVSNLQLQSWFGIGFGPSISGQLVPIGENAAWIDCRNGDLYGRRLVIAGQDMRAPLYYDSQNTFYYVDPGSTSNMNVLQLHGSIPMINGISPPNSAIRLTPNLHLNAGSGSAVILNWDNGTTSGQTFRIGNGAGSDVFYVFANGHTYAPIYYDINNSGYYVDPSETSKTWRMGANYFQSNDPVSADTPFGLYFDSGLSSAYAIYRESGGWAFPFPDLRIAFHTGIKLGANASYQGIRFYTDYDMVTQVMSVNNGSDGVGAGHVFVNNVLQAGGDLRAPIFYDSNNTGFYLDPAGSSLLGTVSLGAQTWRNDITWNNGVNIFANGENSFDVASGATWGVWDTPTGNYMISAAANNQVQIGAAGSRGLYVWGSITATGNVTAYSDIRVKDNVEQIGGALDRLQAIRGVTYTRNDLEDKERRYAGVIAQEIEQVLPEAVFDNDDRKAVDYNATIGLLIEAIKELRAEVEELKATTPTITFEG